MVGRFGVRYVGAFVTDMLAVAGSGVSNSSLASCSLTLLGQSNGHCFFALACASHFPEPRFGRPRRLISEASTGAAVDSTGAGCRPPPASPGGKRSIRDENVPSGDVFARVPVFLRHMAGGWGAPAETEISVPSVFRASGTLLIADVAKI